MSVNVVYYLDHPYRPLYPLDFSCHGPSSTRNSFLRNCSGNYHSNEYQSSSLYEVGIRCTTRTTGLHIHMLVSLMIDNFNGTLQNALMGKYRLLDRIIDILDELKFA